MIFGVQKAIYWAFNITIDHLVKKINVATIGGIKLLDLHIKSLEYADDIHGDPHVSRSHICRSGTWGPTMCARSGGEGNLSETGSHVFNAF